MWVNSINKIIKDKSKHNINTYNKLTEKIAQNYNKFTRINVMNFVSTCLIKKKKNQIAKNLSFN